nr:hypothetical protein GCM10020063_060870 [Dactylosporangium thailandense]
MKLLPRRRTAARILRTLAALILAVLGNALFASRAAAADGVDLHPVVTSVTFGPGSAVEVKPMQLTNAGPVKATGVVLTIDLVTESGPAPLRFVADRGGCSYTGDTHVACPMPDVPAGATIDAPQHELYILALETHPVPGPPNPAPMPAHLKVSLSAAEPELNPADNTVDSPRILRTVTVGAMDWFVSAQPVDGKVGDVVQVPVSVQNRGPGGYPMGQIVTHVVLPEGATFWDKNPDGCADAPSGRERVCASPVYNEQPDEHPSTFYIRVKIVSPIVTDGEIHIGSMGGDLKPADSTSKIVINVEGVVRPTPTPTPSASASPGASAAPGLAVTGDRTALVVVIGAAVLTAGVALVLLGRRRRVRLETPRD